MTHRRAVLPLVFAVALLAGCSSGDDAGGGFAGGGGGGLSCPVPVGPLAFAVSGRANSPAPGLPQSVQDATVSVLTRAVDQDYRPRVTLIDLDGRPTSAGSDTFTTDAGNGIAAEDDRNQFLNGFGEALTGLRARAPEADVLSALDLAGRSAGGDRPGTVVLVDSGLSTVAPLDFRQRGLLDAPPAETVEALRATNALPGLQGVTVVLAGLGDVAEPQTALSPAQRSSLVALWTAVAEAGGASCVAVVDEPRGGDAPSDVPPVSLVDVPPPPTITPGQATTLPDDNSVGFQPDTAEFRDRNAARAVLTPFAQFVGESPTRRLALTGTSARAGALQGQVDLSARRAEAVKSLLAELGAPADRISTRGVGSEFPGYVNDVGPDGRQLPGPASANRTVIVEPSG
ncbi:outer membrane protein OmpA-like peptidoglycan-associated protein [Actinomycetospora succinea]|uniref:Outer membrane protein OmpA-like peptidoglycan-associated protein n=1 Tax=Actinomycetospora succinea TaxID=663603 RepID=A0A4R6UUB9_9PSEU|nr:OmpA family protein [Actinomycetospora succinea]TDQ48965.1 outer membrane protein OmpA-like peptidoglycan-associated protein [Actinomycetospora succinea]